MPHEFQQRQLALAHYLRAPEGVPAPPQLESRRLKIYSELLYNNLEGFIASGFPVLRSLYGERDWHALIGDFFARHRCHTPYFLKISEEFLAYLDEERGAQAGDPPFLAELAHYEWVELALSVSDEVLEGEVDADGDLLDGVPLLSPQAWPLAYRYPVHRLGPDFQATEPPEAPTFLCVYRDAEDQVKFMAVNPLTARLLELIQDKRGLSGRAVLRQVAGEMGLAFDQSLELAGHRTLQGLRERGILAGVLHSPS